MASSNSFPEEEVLELVLMNGGFFGVVSKGYPNTKLCY